MRLLHTVEFYEPSKGGAQEVIKQISERLARRGHSVTVATSYHPQRKESEYNGVVIAQFDISGNMVKGINGDVRSYQSFLTQGGFDVMLNYAAQTWTTDLALPVLDRIPSKKAIAPLGYSRLHHPQYAAYFRELPAFLKKYDACVYTSGDYQDKKFGDSHGLSDTSFIIPNGADNNEFSTSTENFKEKYNINTKYLFITVANHYFEKGHRFVIDAFSRTGIKDATLVIIGEKPHRHSWYSCYPYCYLKGLLNSKIKVLSRLPRSDVVAAYLEADLFLFGSQIECAPLVMYESFASKTPFITTNVGNVQDHKDYIWIVRDSNEMASRIESFISDPKPYRDIAYHAHKVFNKHHTWEKIVERYENLYHRLLEE